MSALPQQPISSFLPTRLHEDRRSEDRIRSEVKISIKRERSHEWIEAMAVDLCEDGLQLNCTSPMTPGEHIVLHLEVVMPQAVYMGYSVQALVVSGPPTIHSLRLPGRVVRALSDGTGGWNLGVQLQQSVGVEDRIVLSDFLDYLTRGE